MKMRLMCVLGVVMVGMVAHAQKVIVEGDGSSLKAQMELYSRWAKSEAQKAMYFSFADPEAWSNFSTEQFKDVYTEQLKEMFRVVNGELIQVKAWRIEDSLAFGFAPSAKLKNLQDAWQKVPQLYRVQVKRVLGQGLYLAHVSRDNSPLGGATAIVQFEQEGEPYAKGTVLEAYLLQMVLSEELKQLARGEIFSYTYKCVSDELGESVHPPTMKEMADAIKAGVRPLVLASTGAVDCNLCDGSGVDKEKLASAEAAARREAQSLGKRERAYDVLGKRTAKKNHTLGESKAFTAAKMKRNKPKCSNCGGDGKVTCKVFRTLVK